MGSKAEGQTADWWHDGKIRHLITHSPVGYEKVGPKSPSILKNEAIKLFSLLGKV